MGVGGYRTLPLTSGAAHDNLMSRIQSFILGMYDETCKFRGIYARLGPALRTASDISNFESLSRNLLASSLALVS